MSLLDEMDEITEKRLQKTETGDNRLFGVLPGIVTRNYDKEKPGKLCVKVPVRDKDAWELKWARLIMPAGGKKWGFYFMPEAGDQVLLAFEGGNIEKPYVVGCVCRDNDSFPASSADGDNQKKQIVTKYGNTLCFEDNREGEGEKDKILLQTAKKMHRLILDNENKKIILGDQKGENGIELKTEAGEMKLKVKSKLTIEVGDSIKITLNGESGAMKIDVSEFKVKTQNQLKMESDSNVSIKGAQVGMKASSIWKAESSGAVKLAGSPVSLG